MQTSVPGEIRQRLDLYRRCFELCRHGGFSFARLCALPPERLRLAVGERGARTRVPVTVDTAIVARLERSSMRKTSTRAPALVADGPALRRAIRIAQVDADLSPLAVLEWMERGADDWLATIAAVERVGVSEIGRGEGGLETAYLVHLVLLRQLTELLDERGAPAALRSWAAAGVDLGVQALAGSDDVDPDLPLRLALQLRATTNPYVLGASEDDFERRSLTAYRTHPTALRLVRSVVVAPVEIIDLERVVGIIAKRLAVDEDARRELLRATLVELVRDALLLIFFRSYTPVRRAAFAELEAVLSSEQRSTQIVFNERRRGAFRRSLDDLSGAPARAVEAVKKLLDAASSVESGDPTPLGVHGDVTLRATLAARGAVVSVLDRQTAELTKTVTSPIAYVDEQYDRSERYRIALDDRPLYSIAPTSHEAVLFIDGSELAARARSPRSIREVLARHLFTPAAELASTIGAGALRRVHVSQRGVGYAGDVVSIVALAEAVDERIVAQIATTFGDVSPDALGGRSERIDDIAAERRRLEARLEELATNGSGSRSGDAETLLLDRIAMLDEEGRRIAPAPPIVGAYVAWGEVAEPGPDDAWFSPALLEAERGAASDGLVSRDRERRLASARLEASQITAHLFRVEVGRDGGISNGGVVLSTAALDAYVRAKSHLFERTFVDLSAPQLATSGHHLVDGRERFEVVHAGRDNVRLVVRVLPGCPYVELIPRRLAAFDSVVEAVGRWT